jgi:transcriptional regulator with XRE-family HTH domain
LIQIGSTLREARERQGLERREVEQATRIRARYLAALEDERFESLPARAYAKGFLRVYADFLGLDGRLFVDEFNARFPEVEQPEFVPRRASVPVFRAWAPHRPAVLGTVLAIALLGVLAWRLGAAHRTPAVPASPPATTRPSRAATPPVAYPPRRATTHLAHLVLRARGRCWIFVRVGSDAGQVLYEATLAPGQILRYTIAPSRPQLWVRVGAPSNLEVSLNGRPAANLPIGPSNIVVNRNGIRLA